MLCLHPHTWERAEVLWWEAAVLNTPGERGPAVQRQRGQQPPAARKQSDLVPCQSLQGTRGGHTERQETDLGSEKQLQLA